MSLECNLITRFSLRQTSINQRQYIYIRCSYSFQRSTRRYLGAFKTFDLMNRDILFKQRSHGLSLGLSELAGLICAVGLAQYLSPSPSALAEC